MFRMSSVAHGWVLGRLKPIMSVATSVITSLKLLVMTSTSPSSSSRGPNLPPILATNRLEMFRLSKLNLSLVFLAFFEVRDIRAKGRLNRRGGASGMVRTSAVWRRDMLKTCEVEKECYATWYISWAREKTMTDKKPTHARKQKPLQSQLSTSFRPKGNYMGQFGGGIWPIQDMEE